MSEAPGICPGPHSFLSLYDVASGSAIRTYITETSWITMFERY